MSMLNAFQTPELEPIINGNAANVLMQLDGSSYAAGLASLFTVFVGVCQQAGFDTGAEFEYTLATFEGRTAATHRAPLSVQ
jgi:hypothetical protein